MNKRQKKKTMNQLGQAIEEGRGLTRSERKLLRKSLSGVATRLRGRLQ